jgi:hypothetical protein
MSKSIESAKSGLCSAEVILIELEQNYNIFVNANRVDVSTCGDDGSNRNLNFFRVV